MGGKKSIKARSLLPTSYFRLLCRMCETLRPDIQALIKAIAVRCVDLRDDVPTGRARTAAQDREEHLRHPFSFVL